MPCLGTLENIKGTGLRIKGGKGGKLGFLNNGQDPHSKSHDGPQYPHRDQVVDNVEHVTKSP